MLKKIVIWLRIAAYLLIYYMLTAIVQVVQTVHYAISYGITELYQFEDITVMTKISEYLMTQAPLAAIIASILSLIAYNLILKGSTNSQLDTVIAIRILRGKEHLQMAGIALVTYLITAIAMSIATMFAPAASQIAEHNAQITQLFTGNEVLVILSMVFVIPIFEEILFRGLCYHEFAQTMPKNTAVVMQALLFGVAHFNLTQSTYAFVLGLVLGVVYKREHTILAPMTIHITFNALSVIPALLIT